MLQDIIVVGIIVIAAAYIVRRYFRKGHVSCGCGCGCSSCGSTPSCCGCDDSEKSTQLDDLRAPRK